VRICDHSTMTRQATVVDDGEDQWAVEA